MAQFLGNSDKIIKKPYVKKPSSKDNWDKIDIISKSLGSLLTGLLIAGLGFFAEGYLSRKESNETNARLYTEIMSRREEADNSLRKDMFNSFIANFLKPEPADLEQKVLNVELLAFNFNESIDFSPLFHNVRQQIIESKHIKETSRQIFLNRLEKVSKDIISKQIYTLAESGGKDACSVNLKILKKEQNGMKLLKRNVMIIQDKDTTNWKVELHAQKYDPKKQEINLKLSIQGESGLIVDATFWNGYFDFPMINNFRLPKGQRCAVALTNLSDDSAEITFLYFPASRASLKDKPYFDEIINNYTRSSRAHL